MITILTWGQGKRKTYPEVDVEVSCLGLDNPPIALWSLDGRDVELRMCIAWQLASNKQRGAWFGRVEAGLLKCAKEFENLRIGFYCFGGRHRSVAIAELMTKVFKKNGYRVSVNHLELR